MAISVYSDLKSAITDWLARSDLTAFADTAIELAEADFNRVLRVRDMETYDTLTPDSNGEATLPTDYLQWRTVTALLSPRIELEYIAPSYMEDQYGDRASGYPAFFTIRGTKITVVPLTTYDVRFDYYQSIPALSSSNTTNWLLTKYPNLYLYQCLSHCATYIKDSGGEQTYTARANAAREALIADDSMSRYTRASARISGPTP